MTTALLERPAPARGPVEGPGRPAAWVVPPALAVLGWSALVLSGVDTLQAARLVLVVAVQVLTGAVLWRLARGPATVAVSELLGMGTALGTLLAMLGAQLLRPTPLGPVGWLAATALVALTLLAPAVRARFRTGTVAGPGVDEVAAVSAGLAAALLFLWSFWRNHPLSPTGWWSYYVDIPYHEALATSLATWGPGDSIVGAGEPVRYHWFVHAWSGSTTDAAGAGSFVVITRVLPLVAFLGVLCLVVTWSRRLSAHRAVPFLAVLLVAVGLNVASASSITFLQHSLLSPSLGFGALSVLGAAVVLTDLLRGSVRWPYALLGLFAVGCVGGKTSFAAVLGGGIGLLALSQLRDRGTRRRALAALAVVLVAVAGAYVVLIMGSKGDLVLQPGATARAMGFAGEGRLGLVIGTGATLLLVAARWAGVAALLSRRPQPEVWFAVGAGAAGLFLLSVLAHPGFSQLYFPISAGVVVSVVAAAGVGAALTRMTARSRWTAAAVGVTAGVLGLVAVPEHPWIPPYLVWALPLLVAAVVFLRRWRQGGPDRLAVSTSGAVAVAAWALTVAALTAGQVALVDTARTPPPVAAAPGAPLAWAPDQAAALVWLRDHSAVDDVVVTNRQCSAPQVGAAPCDRQRWFMTAALAERRTYVEGADYVAGLPHAAWVDERVERSRRFVDAPGEADARVLWDAGVRWVVVDLASTTTRTWSPWAEPAYATDTTVVLRLERP
ncbi:hypothetical protein [Modestobacter roseus]|uniref:4-amino-4-deoxy-L-arabinose transferase-like glycosyltransferase n=1 Tax=Modestobacter roseus TaxID=1181884 RepID=A0A562IT83_9ACTN|nr:hypothetical protein [Modestobacter roseus]MQA33313.1 hypothetical protein [Modestobacter roseus]TWH74239.1 hypothetical protein JD78_02774 [Modestobacter roseus]